VIGIQSVRWIDELMNRWSNECVGWFNVYLVLVLQNVLLVSLCRTHVSNYHTMYIHTRNASVSKQIRRERLGT